MLDNLSEAISNWKTSNSFHANREVIEHKQENDEYFLIIKCSMTVSFQGKTELLSKAKLLFTNGQNSNNTFIHEELTRGTSIQDLKIFERYCEIIEDDLLNDCSEWTRIVTKDFLHDI